MKKLNKEKVIEDISLINVSALSSILCVYQQQFKRFSKNLITRKKESTTTKKMNKKETQEKKKKKKRKKVNKTRIRTLDLWVMSPMCYRYTILFFLHLFVDLAQRNGINVNDLLDSELKSANGGQKKSKRKEQKKKITRQGFEPWTFGL